MKSETTNNKISENRILSYLILAMVMNCNACMTTCKREIVVYQGRYFQKGQSFDLSVDGKTLLVEKFDVELQRNEIKEVKTFCCTNDSCKVKFVLGQLDTVFYISPNKTKRLLVGSDLYGKFSIATDEDKRAWIKM